MTNTKTRSRRKFTAEFKAKVAMEALQEKLTLSELSKKYEVHPNLITKWKNQLKEQSTSVFKERGEATDDAKDKLIEQLYKTIGSLTMDVEFLKKSCHYEQGRAQVHGFQGASSPRQTMWSCWKATESPSAWTAVAVPWTTSSSSGCGAA